MIHFSEQYSQMITRELKFNIINVSNVNFIFLLYFSFNILFYSSWIVFYRMDNFSFNHLNS